MKSTYRPVPQPSRAVGRKSSSDAYAPFVRGNAVKPYLSDADKGLLPYQPYPRNLARWTSQPVNKVVIVGTSEPKAEVAASMRFGLITRAFERLKHMLQRQWERLRAVISGAGK